MDKINILEEAKKVFDIEIAGLKEVRNNLNGDFEKIVKLILDCKGRVIITGMGKSGHVGRKIAATMSSLGIPTYYLQPSEGLHGDLGMISRGDIVIAISNSGETEEVIRLIPSIKIIESTLISITCKKDSTLGRHSDVNIVLGDLQEACNLGLAPTSTTTSTMVFGDALAVVLSKVIGFTKESFGVFHPDGALGRRLLIRVSDLMHQGEFNPRVKYSDSIKKAIIEITGKGMGAVNVVDENNKLIGLITAGDLIRKIENENSYMNEKVSKIMNDKPITIREDLLAVDALNLMKSKEKTMLVLPVVDEYNYSLGIINLNDIIKARIF